MPSNYVSDSNELPDSSQEVDSSDSNLRSVFRSNFAKFDWYETGLTCSHQVTAAPLVLY